ncbi:aspartyl protease family protein [Flavobacteriaceae bacterium 14752]|uniref:aspartyl protease family protein n=1 Tax=Mesohalobacter salilacus TaxID=2491711 RepID=UPI000F644103|nr:PDZ domain-containing protein [Flavobacteriaceae bacterium 14752]
MLKLIKLVSLFFFICGYQSKAQDVGFEFHRENKRSYKINFVNFNNLIIVKTKLNGQPMNFLLDTGVDKTVLFGLKDRNKIVKKTSQKIIIKGVSGQYKTYAYKVENNLLELHKFKDKSHDVYVIFDANFNLSDKIGYPIQGILGYDFFKNHIVRINYIRDFVKVYNPKYFNKSLKSYDAFDMRIHKNKPYIQAALKQTKEWQDYVFLLDTGSGDAIWVKQHGDIDIPPQNFADILGYGFSDIIKGIRAKAKAFEIGSTTLKSPKIAYPDSLSYQGVSFTSKSGIIGSEIMRRFHWYFDYENNKVYIKPNADLNEDFNYDMSGLVLKYDGFQSIAFYNNIFPNVKVQNDNSEGYNKINNSQEILIKLRPILKVGAVRHNSSAFEAGFVEDDVILEINGRKSHKYDLQEIMKILSSEEGREIKFTIERGGRVYEKSLTLKSRLSE